MKRIEKAWWELVKEIPLIAGIKIKTNDIPKNLSIKDIKGIMIERISGWNS